MDNLLYLLCREALYILSKKQVMNLFFHSKHIILHVYKYIDMYINFLKRSVSMYKSVINETFLYFSMILISKTENSHDEIKKNFFNKYNIYRYTLNYL